MGGWFNLHSHSNYSKLDGMATVDKIVAKSARLGHPAASVMDHGTMAGAVQLYTACRSHGLAPFIGFEGYLLDPDVTVEEKRANRFHFGITALNYSGYMALVKANNLSHTRPRFSRFPRLTLDDLIELGFDHGRDLAILSGCYFGLVQQKLIHQGLEAARGTLLTLAMAFGDHTFVEVQNHGIDHGDGVTDDSIVSALVDLALDVSLPVIATQDSHYLDQGDKRAHSLMKRMVYGGEDDEFPGETFHVPTEQWVREHYTNDQWNEAEQGIEHLLSLNRLKLPALDTYQVHIPAFAKDADRELESRCQTRLAAMGLSANPRYAKPLKSQLAMVRKLGFANYFLLVSNFREWCKRNSICIEVRGSANGSLILYVLGVTSVDPIKWGLMPERFLAEDRVTPPDVDIDIEDAYRDLAVTQLQKMFSDAGADRHARAVGHPGERRARVGHRHLQGVPRP